MNRLLASIVRLSACLSTAILLANTSSHAVGVATVDLNGATFGKGVDVHLSSGATAVPASASYDYAISGTVHGTGLLSAILPVGTDISVLLEKLQVGSSSVLTGTQLNASGRLPAAIVDREFSGTFAIGGGLNVSGSLRLIGGLARTGQIRFHVINVDFSIPGFTQLGTVVFEPGSKVVVSVKPVIEFVAATQSVRENVGTVNIRVRRKVNTESAVTVQYASSNASATANDFTPVSGTLTFAPGEVVKLIPITIKNRAGTQGVRAFRLSLSQATGGLIGLLSREVVTITDAQ